MATSGFSLEEIKMEAWREELYHFGIKGMKWGVRRYQNADGTYTDAGKKRYFSDDTKKKIKSGAKTAAGIAAGVGVAAAGIGGSARYFNKHPGTAEAFERNIKRGKDKENVSPVEAMSTEVGRGLGSAKEAAGAINKIKNKNSEQADLSKKSNDQLRKEIDRMQLEVRWQDLNQQQISRGKATAEDYLDVAQKVAMTGASLATIGALIYKIKHPAA